MFNELKKMCDEAHDSGRFAQRKKKADRFDIINEFEDWAEVNDPRFMGKYDQGNGRYVLDIFTKYLAENKGISL